MRKAAVTFFLLYALITNAFCQVNGKASLDTDSLGSWHEEYKSYNEKGKYAEGEKLLKKMLNYCLSYDDSIRASFVASNLASHYSDTENLKSAMGYYNIAISLNSLDPNFYEFRGDLKQKLDDFRGALIDYGKALNLANSSGKSVRWELYKAKGGAHLELSQLDEAIDSYSQAIKIISEQYQYSAAVSYLSKELYYNRGVAYYKSTQKESACLDWSQAGEFGLMESYDLIEDYCN